MLNLYTVSTNQKNTESILDAGENFSLIYHNFFDYPLNFADLVKWRAGKKYQKTNNPPLLGWQESQISNKKGYYYLEGREGLIYKQLLRRRISAKKLIIAKKTARILNLIPSIKLTAITGSLAMENSSEDSDIDLMIITKKDSLWFSRLLVHVTLVLLAIPFRRAGGGVQKDRLCLNMWLDESDITWKKADRNFYTAHEIAQIVPLVNKDKTYEKLLWKNRWVLEYWPNSVKIQKNYELRIMNYAKNPLYIILNTLFIFIETMAFKLQYQFMKSKITRETITPTRALFHPQDWGKVVMERLGLN